MTSYRLDTPVTEEQVRKLRVNDIVYISGLIVTARDQAHKRALSLLKASIPLPIDVDGLAIYHCGPVMSRQPDGDWIAVAAGPTTSTRLELYEEEFLRFFRPRIVIGKGGMGQKTVEAMAKIGAVYCSFTGGAAVLAANSIKKVRGVEWLDLGMPEAMWILEVTEFGPLIVTIDSHGNNLYAENAKQVEKNRQHIYRKYKL